MIEFYEMRSNFKDICTCCHDVCKINVTQINHFLNKNYISWCKILLNSLPVSNIKLKRPPRVIIL